MRRLALCLAVAVAALVTAPAALGDGGPLLVTQGNAGVTSPTHPWVHYVALPDGAGGTLLEAVDATRGAVSAWIRLAGSWGIPSLGTRGTTGEGVSRDGRTLVLGSTAGPYSGPSRFLVLKLNPMRIVRRITLDGSFSFDALSPDASRLYLIQYTHAQIGDLSHYIVRGYDLRANRLLPGRIADRSEREESMAGYAMTRTTSADGRWVYTLYQKPSGEPFVHALDTVGAAAYCIDLPRVHGLYNIVLSLRHGDRTLAAQWRNGRPWLRVAVGSWRISYPSAGFPWAWAGGGMGGALALLAASALLLRRRRSKEVEQHAREELGLA